VKLFRHGSTRIGVPDRVVQAASAETEDIEVLVHAFVRDAGSIIIFGATRTDNGRECQIAVDHRPAAALAKLLDYENPVVDVEPWQILGYLS